METGVPELDLPPIDPMSINQIGFTFWNVTAEFSDTKLSGFKNFKMKYSNIDKQKRTWSIGISLPKNQHSWNIPTLWVNSSKLGSWAVNWG